MTKLQQDFEMWAGDTKTLEFTVTGSDGSGYDLTGTTCTWVLENEPGSGSLIRKQTGGSGISVSGSIMTVTISPSDTSGLAGHYYHEAEIIDTASNVSTAAVGTALINKSGAEG